VYSEREHACARAHERARARARKGGEGYPSRWIAEMHIDRERERGRDLSKSVATVDTTVVIPPVSVL